MEGGQYLSAPRASRGNSGPSGVEGCRAIRSRSALRATFSAAQFSDSQSMSVAMKRHDGRWLHANSGYMQLAPVPLRLNQNTCAAARIVGREGEGNTSRPRTGAEGSSSLGRSQLVESTRS